MGARASVAESGTARRVVWASALLLVALSFASYASQFGPRDRWEADDFDPADYRFVAEYFWGVPIAPGTYQAKWNGEWGAFLRTVPFRGVGLGTMYLAVAWLRFGHAPTTRTDVNTAGIALATIEKILLAAALLTLFHVVRRRWGTAAAFTTLVLTAFPSHFWRMCDDFIAEPVTRIVFLFALACAVAMKDRTSTERCGFALIGLLLLASHLKVQWYVGAMLMLPVILVQFRAAGVPLRSSLLLGAATVAIPLSVMAVNWIGWRTTSLNPGIGIHVNLKSQGELLREFSAELQGQGTLPAFTDPTRPTQGWWNIYVGADVSREEYKAFDRYARSYLIAHPRRTLGAFWEGVTLASTVPALQHVDGAIIRLKPLDEPWVAVVRAVDLGVWLMLIVGLWFPDTRVACALALVFWIVPALGHIASLYELRYHMPMAGLGAAAACSVIARIVRTRQGLRLLVPPTTVQ